jgi:DNA-binding CsgD family transcriptional regulator
MVSMTQAHDLVGAFAEMVVDVRDPAVLWPEMLHLLHAAVGFDAGYIAASWGAAMEGHGAVIEHDEPFLKRNLGRLLAELHPHEVAAYTDRARFHTEVWPASRQHELAVFNEVLVPTGMRHMLVRASVRHGNVAGFNLERRRATSPFSDADLRLIDVVAPFLHIVEVLTLDADDFGLEGFSIEHRLSNREAEFVELVGKGLQNAEIAMLARVSVNTVRNTLVKVFEKVGVSTRAELAALSTRARNPKASLNPTCRLPDDGVSKFKALVVNASVAPPAATQPLVRQRSHIIYTPPLAAP